MIISVSFANTKYESRFCSSRQYRYEHCSFI